MQLGFRIGIMVIALIVPVLTLAHGSGQHFMGTVKALDQASLTVETKDKKDVRIVYDEKTKFEKGGTASSAKELTVGERVVVHTEKHHGSDELRAVVVKFGVKRESVKGQVQP